KQIRLSILKPIRECTRALALGARPPQALAANAGVAPGGSDGIPDLPHPFSHFPSFRIEAAVQLDECGVKYRSMKSIDPSRSTATMRYPRSQLRQVSDDVEHRWRGRLE